MSIKRRYKKRMNRMASFLPIIYCPMSKRTAREALEKLERFGFEAVSRKGTNHLRDKLSAPTSAGLGFPSHPDSTTTTTLFVCSGCEIRDLSWLDCLFLVSEVRLFKRGTFNNIPPTQQPTCHIEYCNEPVSRPPGRCHANWW